MRVIAILAVHNEERFIANCLDHLLRHGVEVYLIDNGSTDETVAIARRYLNHGLIGLENLPHNGDFQLRVQLTRKEELAAELPGDWFLHVDADEIRLPPQPDGTLHDALAEVDYLGYNAVNFVEFTFVPTEEAPDHDHAAYLQTMRWYYPFEPRWPYRLNAWKRQPGRVVLTESAGHLVEFPGLRRFPQSFPMRHYLYLSQAHAIRKYLGRRYDPEEVSRLAWHGWRPRLRPDRIPFPRQAELRYFESDSQLDASWPLTRHLINPCPSAA